MPVGRAFALVGPQSISFGIRLHRGESQHPTHSQAGDTRPVLSLPPSPARPSRVCKSVRSPGEPDLGPRSGLHSPFSAQPGAGPDVCSSAQVGQGHGVCLPWLQGRMQGGERLAWACCSLRVSSAGLFLEATVSLSGARNKATLLGVQQTLLPVQGLTLASPGTSLGELSCIQDTPRNRLLLSPQGRQAVSQFERRRQMQNEDKSRTIWIGYSQIISRVLWHSVWLPMCRL